MKYFEGMITMHNGRYERSFGVRLSASNWSTAVKAAMVLATTALKDHFKAMRMKKRVHIEMIHMTLVQYKPPTDAATGLAAKDRLPGHAWLSK